MIVLLFALIGFGVYIGVAMLFTATLGIVLIRGANVGLTTMGQSAFSGTAVFAYTIIPMFMLMGQAAIRSGLTERLYRAFNIWFGRTYGGLALATISTSGLFAAISGSSVAMAAMLSRVAIPEMRKAGYKDAFSGSVLAAAGSFAVLIPPSGMLVIYALLTEQSIGQVLMSGLIPGVITVLLYRCIVTVWARLRPDLAPRSSSYTLKERLVGTKDILPTTGIAFIVVGGIYTGALTPTESAAVGAFLVIILGLARGQLGIKDDILPSSRDAVQTTVQVFLIIVAALLFGRFIALSGLGRELVELAEAAELGRYQLLFVIILTYLVLGTFLEGVASLVITVPLILPLLVANDFDLLWFGVIVVKMIEISVITPPMGFNVLVLARSVPDIDINSVWRSIGIFVVTDLLVVAMLILWPALVTWLPNQM